MFVDCYLMFNDTISLWSRVHVVPEFLSVSIIHLIFHSLGFPINIVILKTALREKRLKKQFRVRNDLYEKVLKMGKIYE